MGLTPMTITPSYLPPIHRVRSEHLRQMELLFSGDHFGYYVIGGHSRYNFRPIKQGGPPFFVPFDLLGLVSLKTADLIFGETPRIRSKDSGVAEAMAELIERSSLQAVLLDAAVECSWAGESYLEICREGGVTYIAHAPVREIFPLGGFGSDGQCRRYVRYATEEVTEGVRRLTLLLETTYEPGAIRCRR